MSDPEAPGTIKVLLAASRAWLERKGSPTPRLDAELLLAHVLGLDRLRLYMNADRELTDDEVDRFRALLRRRGEGESVAYLLGEWEFWGMALIVDGRVLVPRPETELLVEQALALVPVREAALRIVDVGTGSGAIALALARELPRATLVATDLSDDALDVARLNAARHELGERVHFLRADLLDRLVRKGSVADVVVSNPPYVAEDSAELEAGVRRFEPALALFAAEQGLATIRRLIDEAARVLRPGGLLLVEHGHDQGDATRALAHAVGFVEVWTVRDYGGHDRLLVARRPGGDSDAAFGRRLVGSSARNDDGPWRSEPGTSPDAAASRDAKGSAIVEVEEPAEASEEAQFARRLSLALASLGVSSADELDEQQLRQLDALLNELPEIPLARD